MNAFRDASRSEDNWLSDFWQGVVWGVVGTVLVAAPLGLIAILLVG
jgi:hypothetical protein